MFNFHPMVKSLSDFKNPKNGDCVFVENTSCFYCFDNGTWVRITSTITAGEGLTLGADSTFNNIDYVDIVVTKENKKDWKCNCSSIDLFRYGCKCKKG